MSAELAQQDIAARLRALTPARVGLGRVGVSMETRDALDFQLAHARARDAVHARLEVGALATELERRLSLPVLRLSSAVANRAEYLRRPDLGRQLNDASRGLLAAQRQDSDLALVIADGLSALAVERHVPTLLQELLPRLASTRFSRVYIVEQGRVAIGDEIGELQNAQLTVVLIGERPGLSSPDSLGAYITWMPRVGRTDAERICISNIRTEGLGYVQAAEQLERIVNEARRNQLTGLAPRAIAATLGEENR